MRSNPEKLYYKCATCGNECLEDKKPDNTVCGGCNNPDWKLMKHQKAYIEDDNPWIHPNGDI